MPYTKRQWVVFVRGVDGTGDIYGNFGSETRAQRFCDRINRRLPQDADSDAWAYVMFMHSATSPADYVLKQAGIE